MAVARKQHAEALAVSTALTAKYFRALGDPTRLRILELLVERPLTVSDLVRELDCAQSSVSNHLSCLRWCGFVEADNRGKWAYYSVADAKIRTVIKLVRSLVTENAEHVAACVRIADK
ncbi:MAG: metalloregulator ArsR/SmtB family transcription factor [Vulcanimicrobiaceae bacterium]